jgi:hypothetical protein
VVVEVVISLVIGRLAGDADGFAGLVAGGAYADSFRTIVRKRFCCPTHAHETPPSGCIRPESPRTAVNASLADREFGVAGVDRNA